MYKTTLLLVLGLNCCTPKSAEGIEPGDFKSDAPRRYEVSEGHEMLWRDQIKDILRTAQVSEGPQVILYSTGVASHDSWYPTPGTAQTSPPEEERYYEFTYVNGLLVTLHVMDQGKKELVNRLWHDRQGGPVLCVNYLNGVESGYTLATYNTAGLINEVVRFNQDLEPLFLSLFEHTGIYETCMITDYSRGKAYEINHQTFLDGESVWLRLAEDKEWRRVNTGSMRSWLETLQKHGIKPHYPIPAAKAGAAADAAAPQLRD